MNIWLKVTSVTYCNPGWLLMHFLSGMHWTLWFFKARLSSCNCLKEVIWKMKKCKKMFARSNWVPCFQDHLDPSFPVKHFCYFPIIFAFPYFVFIPHLTEMLYSNCFIYFVNPDNLNILGFISKFMMNLDFLTQYWINIKKEIW